MQDLGFNPVVVELNRVRPALAHLFGLNKEKSLAAAVSGPAGVMDCVQKDPSGLSMITAGELDLAGHSSGFETILCQAVQVLQNNFNYILLDAPPILESADVLIAGRIVPNLILVVGAGRASQESIREACRQLSDARINLAGTILNTRKRIIPRWVDRWLMR
jgi:Mrp family chromosome partitioning ATPase